jgi:hypothetical protein
MGRRAVLFLDVQGVLLTRPHPSPGALRAAPLDAAAVAALNAVTGAAPAPELVLSSDWRFWAPLPALAAFLADCGVRGALVGTTTTASRAATPAGRAAEIRGYLAAHPDVGAWAAVDDLDMRPHLPAGAFVWIADGGAGLTAADAAALRAALRLTAAAAAPTTSRGPTA